MTEIEELQQERAHLIDAIAELEARIAAGENGPGLRFALLVMKRQLATVEARLRELGVEV